MIRRLLLVSAGVTAGYLVGRCMAPFLVLYLDPDPEEVRWG